MARKDYPFNKRDLKFGTNLISGILATLIVLPFSLLGNSSSSNNSSSYIGDTEVYSTLKPLRLKISNIICGFFFFLSPLLFIFLIVLNWWVGGALVVTLMYQFIFAIPLIGLTDNLEKFYIFNSFDLRKQIDASKFTLKLWAIIFSIHSVFFLAYNIIQWWALVDYDFRFHYWELYSNDIPYFLYDFLLNIEDISFFTIILLLIIIILNIALSIYYFKWYRNLSNKISGNPSICEISKWSKRVDCKILCELFDRTSANDKLMFANGCCLKRILNSNILDSGFTIIDKSDKEINFCFSKYAESYTGLFRNGNDILKKIAKDINHQLQIHDINYSIHNSANNLDDTTPNN